MGRSTRLVGRCGRAVWQQPAGHPRKSLTQTVYSGTSREWMDGAGLFEFVVAGSIEGAERFLEQKSRWGGLPASGGGREVFRCEISPQQVILTVRTRLCG